MTREEAARTLEVATVLLDSIPEADWYVIAASEACKMGAEALRELDAQEKPFGEWISVKDRLPEKEGSYIVATKNGGVVITRYYDRHNRFSTRLNELITHWMERPEPPKEEHHAE